LLLELVIPFTTINFVFLQVIDMLLFKGMEELNNIVEHAKQRHHVIGQYVIGQQGLVQDMGSKEQGTSDFLKKFYTSNYF
jgi:NADH dehydrogenase (ubiquinone) 1 alpha subcomplex subunit 6